MSKQFQIYANLTIAPEHVVTLRTDVKAIERQMLDAGAWVTAASARMDNADVDTLVRVLVEVSGPKCADADAARKMLVEFADRAAAAYGASFYSLGFALGHTDENLFDERPDLRVNPSNDEVPKPISVQLAEAVDASGKVVAERDAAKDEAQRQKSLAADQAEQLKDALQAVSDLRTEIAHLTAAVSAAHEGRKVAQDLATVAQAEVARLANTYEPPPMLARDPNVREPT